MNLMTQTHRACPEVPEMEHICSVCFTPSVTHDDPDVWPPRCCRGCLCGETMPPEPSDAIGWDIGRFQLTTELNIAPPREPDR